MKHAIGAALVASLPALAKRRDAGAGDPGECDRLGQRGRARGRPTIRPELRRPRQRRCRPPCPRRSPWCRRQWLR